MKATALTDKEGDLAAILPEFLDQEADDTGGIGVEVGGALVVQNDLVGLARPGEPLFGFVVLDHTGDVEAASLQPLLHEGGQTDVDGQSDVGSDVFGLGPAVQNDHLAVVAYLISETLRTTAVVGVAAHGVDVERFPRRHRKDGEAPARGGGCFSYTRRENWLMGVEEPRPRADNIRTVAGKNEDNGGSNVRLHTSQLVLFGSMTFSWYQAGSTPCPYVYFVFCGVRFTSPTAASCSLFILLCRARPLSLSLSLVRPLSLYHRVASSACAVSLRSLSAYNG